MRRRAPLAVALTAALAVAGCQGQTASAPPTPPKTTTQTTAAPTTSASPPAWTVAAENRKPGTTAWRIHDVGGDHAIEGWADHVSVLPGQPVTLRVSTTAPSWHAAAYRLGWYAGTGGRLLWTSPREPGAQQPAPTTQSKTHTVSAADWRPSITVPTSDWPPGDYLFVLTASTGAQRYVPLVVRSASTAGTVVVMNSAFTWQAYNAWGGYSLYHGPDGSFASRAHAVTFDRPYDANGADKFLVYEQPIVAEAERLGLNLSYETDLDVSADAKLLHGATAVLSLGHDEYWTGAERANVLAARDAGANLAFFGANEAYWQVRVASTTIGRDRLVVEYKDAAIDPLATKHPQQTTTRFRSLPDPKPENQLSGLLYECFPAEGDYRIQNAGFWGFAGTGVHNGSVVPGVVGVEIDRAYPIATTPHPIDVVAHSPVRCHGVPTWSDSAYYTTPSRAGVFSTGTMHWTCVLSGSCRQFGATAASTTFVRRVTDNVLREFAKGPAARTHPVTHDNLAALHEPRTNLTGSA